MSEVMKTVLSLSVSGSLLALLIFGLKRLGRNRFSRRWQYYIWIIAVLRFLLPVTPDTTIVGSLFDSLDAVAVRNENVIVSGESAAAGSAGSGENPIPGVESAAGNTAGDGEGKKDAVQLAGNAANGGEKREKSGESAGNTGNHACLQTQEAMDETSTIAASDLPDLYTVLFLLWSAAALVLFARRIAAYRCFARYIRAGSEEVSDISILNLLSDCRERLHIKARVELAVNARINSPMLTGFFRPCIVLPAREWEVNDLAYVFVHELIHYRHRDMFYKWLVQTAVCVHWFNPVVRMLEKEVNRDCELSCDEMVLSVFGDTARRGYGDMLLSFVRADSSCKSSLVSITLTEGAEQLIERLGAIMKYRKKSRANRVLAAVCAAAVSAGFMVSGAYAASPAAQDTLIWTDDRNTNRYTYVHRGFYADSYIIKMGWNWTETMGGKYAGSREVTLADQSAVTVHFGSLSFGDSAGNAAAYMNDAGVLAAIAKLIDSLRDNPLSGYPALEAPLITDVTYVGSDLPALAEEYLAGRDAMGFAAVFSVLGAQQQEEYCQKLYDGDEISLFASVLPYVDRAHRSLYADRAEADGKWNFFSVLLQYMESEDINRYAEQYYEAGDTARFAAIAFYMTPGQRQVWLERAEADRKNAFTFVLN